MYLLLVFYLSLQLFVLSGLVHGAETFRCPAGVATVEGEGSLAVACEAAQDAVRMLGKCGLSQSRPFRAHIVAELPEECPTHALGFFDASTERVVVAEYETCLEMTESEERFGLRMDRALYRSLLVHEFTHALVEQNASVNRAAHEYIAYAIQFSSMEKALRARILAKYPHEVPISEKELNDSYFYLSPPDFAVKAYSHFGMPENGCRFIQKLIRGETKLPSGIR